MQWLTSAIERLLWASRFLVLIAVFASLASSAILFYVASGDVLRLFGSVAGYTGQAVTHISIIGHVAEIIDGYLFAAILIIFALGLYSLFIARLQVAEHSEVARRLLLITSIDELKERLAKVVFLILVVRYFQFTLEHEPQTSIELLELAVGIALIALALFLTNRTQKASAEGAPVPDRSGD